MKFNSTFYLFFASALTIAVVHNVAAHFFLYWSYPWLDMPMHFFGGATVALGYHVFLSKNIAADSFWRGLQGTLIAVLAVGLAWEIFEYAAGIILLGFQLGDTVLDIILDLLGGAFGYMLVTRLRTLEETHE